ncbi:MAG: STAS domain-containing protein [Thermodesulfobacteriota bacterium]|nr:STAS domain-containing protein [Thermodesulfobacteriota bacterium]
MEIEQRREGDILVAKILNDRLDARGADDFRKAMSGFVSDGNRRIILDISAVDFVDSSGLGALVSALKLMGGDGDILICGAPDPVMRMFKLTRMNKVFRIFEEQQDAVRALSVE